MTVSQGYDREVRRKQGNVVSPKPKRVNMAKKQKIRLQAEEVDALIRAWRAQPDAYDLTLKIDKAGDLYLVVDYTTPELAE